jgi:hypothetical protein
MAPTSRVSPQDPVAAVLFGILMILGALKVLSRLGIDADAQGMIIGGAMMIAAGVRAWRDAKKAPLLGTIVVEPHGDIPPELAEKLAEGLAKAKAARE